MDIWRRAFCAEGPVVSGWCLCFLNARGKGFCAALFPSLYALCYCLYPERDWLWQAVVV